MAEVASAAAVKDGLRRLAAGVTLVTAAADGDRRGLTATAVCSVTVEPPRILACVNHKSSTLPLALSSRAFAVNVLDRSQEDLAKLFAGMTGVADDQRFTQGDWIVDATGAPVLADAQASFDCALVETIEQSTHMILIGEVRSCRASGAPTAPLLYVDGAFGGVC